jgi:hypothetical protein
VVGTFTSRIADHGESKRHGGQLRWPRNPKLLRVTARPS